MTRPVQLNSAQVRHMIDEALTGSGDAAQLVHRLDCVLLVAQGRGCGEVADWFGIDQRTVQRWVHNAYVNGLQGLALAHRGGRPCALGVDEAARVEDDLQAPPARLGYAQLRWTGKLLARHLSTRYHTELAVRTCQRLLKASRATQASAP